jgi:hypothetical protein
MHNTIFLEYFVPDYQLVDYTQYFILTIPLPELRLHLRTQGPALTVFHENVIVLFRKAAYGPGPHKMGVVWQLGYDIELALG